MGQRQMPDQLGWDRNAETLKLKTDWGRAELHLEMNLGGGNAVLKFMRNTMTVAFDFERISKAVV